MNDYFSRFSNAPVSFKKSFCLLVVAWTCHPLFIYSLFWTRAAVEGADKDILKMAIVSLSLCVLLFLIKRWARALVLVGSFFIVVNDLFYYLVTPHHKVSTILCVVVVLFSIMGIYWLFTKDSRDYFTQVDPKLA
jgi:Na+(H+)/acetate symporter ActP